MNNGDQGKTGPEIWKDIGGRRPSRLALAWHRLLCALGRHAGIISDGYYTCIYCPFREPIK